MKIKSVTKIAAVCVFSIGLTGCVTGAGEKMKELGDTITKWVIPDKVEPFANSLIEEYCAAPLVLQTFGPERLGQIAQMLSSVQSNFVSQETKEKSLYCSQNLAGVILMTDRSMNAALDEVQMGIVAANAALGLNEEGQKDILAQIAVMKSLTIQDKLNSSYIQQLQSLDTKMAVLQSDATKKLEALAKSGGITKEGQGKLIEAHKNFVNFRYHQGKALSGIAIYGSALKVYGPIVLKESFVQALRIDKQNRSDKSKGTPVTESVVTAFVTALPKFAETSFSAVEISSAIWDAADTADFEEALEDTNEPDQLAVAEMGQYATDITASTASLGLPGVSGLGG